MQRKLKLKIGDKLRCYKQPLNPRFKVGTTYTIFKIEQKKDGIIWYQFQSFKGNIHSLSSISERIILTYFNSIKKKRKEKLKQIEKIIYEKIDLGSNRQ